MWKLLIVVILHVHWALSDLYPGRPLYIKSYPGIPNIQSDLYEVYQEPYVYNVNIIGAVAVLQGEGESSVKGEITFTQRQPPVGPVLVRGNITGLKPGKHGFHIYQSGDLRHGCEKLGNHFNPFLLQHGDRRDPLRHVGDLGNIEAKDDGSVEVEFVDSLLSLVGGGRSVVGRALVIAENEDDLGRGGTAESVSTGNSGKPIACAVIAYT
ncbi:superoxide dismutase [Cu-Zn]-like [Photinus pyralis]|uniref:superoxide dismutase n=1 Tax=Photinus pyralis TaxID=7054 RepID=A0A1Y1MG08_PHOPY|nr:superoxide dismutase [Cu-Zn]-like [Photinus pyralis]